MLPPDIPVISVSKGLEVSSGQMMSEIIPSALQRKQPAVFLSGPSFAREVMDLRPTVVVAASKVRTVNCLIWHLMCWHHVCTINATTAHPAVVLCRMQSWRGKYSNFWLDLICA